VSADGYETITVNKRYLRGQDDDR